MSARGEPEYTGYDYSRTETAPSMELVEGRFITVRKPRSMGLTCTQFEMDFEASGQFDEWWESMLPEMGWLWFKWDIDRRLRWLWW